MKEKKADLKHYFSFKFKIILPNLINTEKLPAHCDSSIVNKYKIQIVTYITRLINGELNE